MKEQDYIKEINLLKEENNYLRNGWASEKAVVSEAIKMMDSMCAQIEALEKKVAVLEKRLAAAEKQNIKKTSNNSNLPPSKDIAKKKRINNRVKSNKKPGGQFGHKAHFLELSNNPDIVTNCLPHKNCTNCGKPLNFDSKKLVKVKQEIDIPPMTPIIEQFEQYQISCNCGHTCTGHFPHRLKAKVQYGARTRAMISYLSTFQYLPFQRMKDLFRTFFSIDIAKATLCNAIKRSSKVYKKAYRFIKDFIQNSDIVGADETHITINGNKSYFWVWQNIKATFIACENDRKKDNIDKHFPNGFPFAVIVSDRYASHLNTAAKAHQICWVHLLRHLKYLKQTEDNPWIHKLQKLFNKAKQLKIQKNAWSKDDYKTLKLERDFDELLAIKIDKSKFKETETLRESLRNHREKILTFLYVEGCPFHNNASEKAIRNAKVKMNISLQFITGGQYYAIIRSVVDTLIKNDLPIFDSLFKLEQGADIHLPFAS